MDRAAVIARLRDLRPRLTAEGIARLYLFGSMLRDEATAESDIDLLFDHGLAHFGLIEYARLKRLAADLLGHEVDLIERSCLDPLLRARVEAEARRIF